MALCALALVRLVGALHIFYLSYQGFEQPLDYSMRVRCVNKLFLCSKVRYNLGLYAQHDAGEKEARHKSRLAQHRDRMIEITNLNNIGNE